MTCPADAPSPEFAIWDFKYHYSVNHGDLYYHGEGNGDEICAVTLFETGEACNVLNRNVDGKAYIFSPNDSSKCCKYPVHLGALLPDWLERAGAKFAGVDLVNGVDANHWQAEGAYTNNYWSSVEEGDLPVRFNETKTGDAGGLKQWDFELGTYKVGEVDEALFEIPGGRCGAPCVPRG